MTKRPPCLTGSRMISVGLQRRKNRNQRLQRVSITILASTDPNRLHSTQLVFRTHPALWAKTDFKLVVFQTLVWQIKTIVAQALSHLASKRSPKSQSLTSLKQTCFNNRRYHNSQHSEVASPLEVLITRGSSRQQTCSSLSSSRLSLAASSHRPWRRLSSIKTSKQGRSSHRVQYLVRLPSSPSQCSKWLHRQTNKRSPCLASRW